MRCTDCRGIGRFTAKVVADQGPLGEGEYRAGGRRWRTCEPLDCATCGGSGDVLFDAISASDGHLATRATFYASLYPSLRQRAYELGYALTLHGSLVKDLDVVAVPWTESAAPERELVAELCDCAGGFLDPGQPSTAKPHGRRAYTIHLGRNGGYVDLSVMPRMTP